MLTNYYSSQKTFGLEKYFMEIDEWVNKEPASEEQNKPLLIEAEEGSGKKTLLVNWVNYHTNNTSEKQVGKLFGFLTYRTTLT